jgi:hypothetical protein
VNFQSTAVRFAISSLKAFEYVRPLALSIMISQAAILKELDKDLEGRPYTGCVSPVPDKFTVAQQPHMCLYGLLYYEKICSAKARELFKDYVKESTRKKVLEEDIHAIEILVDQTPHVSATVLADMVLKLSVVNAEAVINRQPESERHYIRQLILSSSKESDLRNHYRKQAEDAAIMNISVAAKKKLEIFKTTIISISSGKVAAATNNEEKSLAYRKQAQLMDLASEVERQLSQSADHWAAEVPQYQRELASAKPEEINNLFKQLTDRMNTLFKA